MTKTDKLAALLDADVRDKDVLEVACGGAEFSLSALRAAKSVSAIDLDDSRLSPRARGSAIRFQIMDAAHMSFPDRIFDTVVIYNAFAHIESQWDEIEKECRRVCRPNGALYVASTWKLDTGRMEGAFGAAAKWRDGFLIARL